MTRKCEEAKGRCYDAAFALLDFHPSDVTVLCHGIVTRTLPPHERMGHAWLEVRLPAHGNTVICVDALYPADPVDKERYYKTGNIDPKDVVRYTVNAARENALHSGNTGPWDKKILAAAHANDEEKVSRNCRDCTYCALDLEDFYCTHPKSFELSPVFGRSTNAFRSDGAPCGIHAALFEPRKK